VGHGGVPGKFDLVSTPKGVGLVKGKRSSGYFAVAELDGTPINNGVRAATCVRLACTFYHTHKERLKPRNAPPLPLKWRGFRGLTP